MIGNLVAQLLQRAGGRVVGIDPVAERRALATRCGLGETLDPTAANFRDQIQTSTRGAGLDIAVDTTGHAPTTLGMPSFIRPRGQMVLMTHWRSQPTLDAAPFMYEMLVKGITFHGAHESAPALAPALNAVALQRRKWLKIMHELTTGGVQVSPLISHIIQPPQCKEAYDGLSFDRATWWGVVVDWRG